jgi:hypothetical protein
MVQREGGARSLAAAPLVLSGDAGETASAHTHALPTLHDAAQDGLVPRGTGLLVVEDDVVFDRNFLSELRAAVAEVEVCAKRVSGD